MINCQSAMRIRQIEDWFSTHSPKDGNNDYLIAHEANRRRYNLENAFKDNGNQFMDMKSIAPVSMFYIWINIDFCLEEVAPPLAYLHPITSHQIHISIKSIIDIMYSIPVIAKRRRVNIMDEFDWNFLKDIDASPRSADSSWIFFDFGVYVI